MIKNATIAQELGYLELKQPFVASENVGDLQDDKVLFLCTGSQGQPMAALSRLASGSHRKINLKPGDTVIMSSNPIPGNEEAVGRVINQLYERRVNVFYPPTYKVHASGHASQEELKLILDLTRPRFFMPWHGEMRHQVNHQRLAEGMSHPPRRCSSPTTATSSSSPATTSRSRARSTPAWCSSTASGGPATRSPNRSSATARCSRPRASSSSWRWPDASRRWRSSRAAWRRATTDWSRRSNASRSRVCRSGVREKRRLNDIRDDIFYPVRRYIRKATGRNPLIVPTVLQG